MAARWQARAVSPTAARPTINASQVDGNIAPGAFGGGILNHGAMTVNASAGEQQRHSPRQPGGQGGGGGIANLDITPLTWRP